MGNIDKLVDYLAAVAEISEASYEAWFLSRLNFKAQGNSLPPDVVKQTPKECFTNATILSLGTPGLRYCEGYAMRDDIQIPLHHAWCVTEDGQVVDNTWDSPESAVYAGFIPDRNEYEKWIVLSGYYGLVGGHWQTSRLLFKAKDLAEANRLLERSA